MKKYIYFLLLIFSSYLVTRVLYGSYHFDNIFAGIIYVILGTAWVYLFYMIFESEHKVYRQQHRIFNYWKTVLSLLSLIPLFFIYSFYHKKISVQNLIQAQRHGVYAYFKVDGTYFIRSGSWGSKKHFYGNYTLKDSIIKLDKSNLDNVLTSNTFVIRHSNSEVEKTRPDYDRIESKKYLVQLDSGGHEIIARCISIDNAGIKDCMPYKFEIVDSIR